MTNKQLIQKVLNHCEGGTIACIANDLNGSRSKLYSFMKSNGNDERFIKLIKEKFYQVFDDEKEMITEDQLFNVPEKFTGENQNIIEKKGTERSKGSKYVAPSKFLRMKNLRCENNCYMMKVPLRDFDNLPRPICPHCDSRMLTREERKEKGLEF